MRRAISIEPERSTGELVRAITEDTAELVRKEVQLAKQEMIEALTDRVKALAAIAGGGVMGLFASAFIALAVADALALTMPRWSARLIVAVAFLILVVLAVSIGKRVRKHPIVPEETARTLKEDVRWVKQQLTR